MNYLTMRTWRNSLLSAEAPKEEEVQKRQMTYTTWLHNLVMQKTDTTTRQQAASSRT